MPRKKPTKSQLIKRADTWWSRYIRLRDCEFISGRWQGECIDGCGRIIGVLENGHWNKESNVGHFISRGHHHLRFDELNCNLQAAYCNAWRDKSSMLEGYAKGLDLKYGDGTAEQLKREATTLRKLTTEELLQIIEECKVYIKVRIDNDTH